jgi:hypothetical protein
MPNETLKLVVAWSARRNLCDTVADAVRRLTSNDLRQLGDDAIVVWTSESASDLRDLLCADLNEDEGLLVVDFEQWSGYGKALDQTWLLSHGH